MELEDDALQKLRFTQMMMQDFCHHYGSCLSQDDHERPSDTKTPRANSGVYGGSHFLIEWSSRRASYIIRCWQDSFMADKRYSLERPISSITSITIMCILHSSMYFALDLGFDTQTKGADSGSNGRSRQYRLFDQQIVSHPSKHLLTPNQIEYQWHMGEALVFHHCAIRMMEYQAHPYLSFLSASSNSWEKADPNPNGRLVKQQESHLIVGSSTFETFPKPWYRHCRRLSIWQETAWIRGH